MLSDNETQDFEQALRKCGVRDVLGTPTDMLAGRTATGERTMSLQTVQAMSKWLESSTWTFFVTFTTRYEASPKALRRATERTWNLWKKSCDGPLKFFWVMEKHKHRGYHTHGLLDCSGCTTENSDIQTLNDYWESTIKAWQRSAGLGRTEEAMAGIHRNSVALFDNSQGAVTYCCKYLTKQQADWDYHVHIP